MMYLLWVSQYLIFEKCEGCCIIKFPRIYSIYSQVIVIATQRRPHALPLNDPLRGTTIEDPT